MAPADRIALQPWMTAPETRAVLEALMADGSAVRFVGGCVRDAVLGRPVTGFDIDIATPDPPETVIRLLARARIRAIPTGIEHGTVTAVLEARRFEITTLRRDVETDGRHARVAIIDDWAVDAGRPDYNKNAVFCDPDRTLYDPVGGLDDLRQGRVRFVGDPRARIDEDKLRLLRFFRFHAWYGRQPMQAAALTAARELAPELARLSGERIRDETLKLLAAADPAPVIQSMADNQVLGHFLPEARNIRRLAGLVTVEGLTVGADPLRRLAALIVDAAAAGEVAARLRLSNHQRRRLESLTAPPQGDWVRLDRRAIYRLGGETVRDLALLGWAEGGDAEDWRRLIDDAERWTPPGFPLRGADVLALGVPPGPRVGELLARVEAWWIAGDFTADRDAARAHLRTLVDEVG